jgi:hypothetical protein
MTLPSPSRKRTAVRDFATSAFVLAGLDPAIHAFDACNEDVDTRDKPAQDDFISSSIECEHGMLEAGISPYSPALSRQ